MSSNRLRQILFFVPFKFKDGVAARTDRRDCTIVPFYVDRVIEVYNGKNYVPLTIKPDMVGYKLGDFIPTKVLKPKPPKVVPVQGSSKKKKK